LLCAYKIPFPVEGDKSPRVVSIRQVGIERQSPIGGCDRLVAHFRRGNELEPCTS